MSIVLLHFLPNNDDKRKFIAWVQTSFSAECRIMVTTAFSINQKVLANYKLLRYYNSINMDSLKYSLVGGAELILEYIESGRWVE